MSWFSSPAVTELSISLDTLIGVAPILGQIQESRESVRAGQDPEILDFWLSHASIECNDDDIEGFIVSPFDVLVEKKEDNSHLFHVIEFNGTGIGGLTNLPLQVASTISQELGIQCVKDSAPLILVAASGLEDPEKPRYNRVMFEKILYADHIRAAFLKKNLPCQILSVGPQGPCPEIPSKGAVIVLGYMKDLLKNIELNSERELVLGGRRVSTVINDRFFLNALQKTDFTASIADVRVLNKSYKVGADKSCAYNLLNKFQKIHGARSFPAMTSFAEAKNLKDLIAEVGRRLDSHEKCLIKPSGTGLGHGIEFFLDFKQSKDEIKATITESVDRVSKFYGLEKGAFPYAVCPFVDTATISGDHAFAGRKFELRVVVFKKGNQICAVPSIAKISSSVYDSECIDKKMLINNISTSSHQTKQAGSDFILPLANTETLKSLGLDPMVLADLARDCAKLMSFSLEQMRKPKNARFSRAQLIENQFSISGMNPAFLSFGAT